MTFNPSTSLQDLPGIIESYLENTRRYIPMGDNMALFFCSRELPLGKPFNEIRKEEYTLFVPHNLVLGTPSRIPSPQKLKRGAKRPYYTFLPPEMFEPNHKRDEVNEIYRTQRKLERSIRSSLKKIPENEREKAREILEDKLTRHCIKQGKLDLGFFLGLFDIIDGTPSPDVLAEYFKRGFERFEEELRKAYETTQDLYSDRMTYLVHVIAHEIYQLKRLTPELRKEVVQKVKQSIKEKFERVVNVLYLFLAEGATNISRTLDRFRVFFSVSEGVRADAFYMWERWMDDRGRYRHNRMVLSPKEIKQITRVEPTEEVSEYIRQELTQRANLKSLQTIASELGITKSEEEEKKIKVKEVLESLLLHN